MKNIFFDLDGTLTDPKIGIITCIKYALEKLNTPTNEDLSWCIGPPLQESFSKILEGDANKVETAISYYRDRFADIGMFENEVYEGITSMLMELTNKKFILYVVTSKPHVYAKKIVNHFGIGKFFKEVYGSELNGERSDKGELIKYVLEQTNISSDNTIMVGDRKHDLIGAHKNNVKSLGVSWGYGSLEELEVSKPLAVYTSRESLTNYFLELKLKLE